MTLLTEFAVKSGLLELVKWLIRKKDLPPTGHLNKTHMVEGEKKLLKAVLGPAPALCHVHMHLPKCTWRKEERTEKKLIKVLV